MASNRAFLDDVAPDGHVVTGIQTNRAINRVPAGSFAAHSVQISAAG
jgi:hypothetical protein